MADRFWVGGAGNWSSTTKWSATTGGASGASVPTSADAAIFDANSGGKFIATVDTAQSVNSLTITPSSGAGVLQIALTAPLTTVNLTTTGTAGNNRIWFRSNTYGISINFIVDGTVSISDCDFRGVYVLGTAAPISGTRIGNRGECRGITFSTPKTVYWNLAGVGVAWAADAWATTSAGTPSTDNFPLPQDTATFTNAGSAGTISLVSSTPYLPTVDMSSRTTAMAISFNATNTVYGSWLNGSGVSFSGNQGLTFSGGTTQTITSAGKTFTCPITVDTYGGTVQLADALNIGTSTFLVANGIFDTSSQNFTAQFLDVGTTNVRAIYLRASTITALITGTSTTNLTFNAGTSTIVGSTSIALAFYDVNILVFGNSLISFYGSFRNATITHDGAVGVAVVSMPTTSVSISGTLTVTGTTAIARVNFASETLGTQTTLSVATLASLSDADFTDVVFSGAAAPATGTRLGDCGGNSGVTFLAPKTVYWNLAGAQNWYSAGWATSSGGSPAANNFPLPQDTAVFNNAGSVTGTITIPFYSNIGTMDASARTTAMTLFNQGAPYIFGDFKLGTGVTTSGTGNYYSFSGRGTQTITSNGRTFVNSISIFKPFSDLPTVQLADALTISAANTFTLQGGTFDAVIYNFSAGTVVLSANTVCKMGTGTWTCSNTATSASITVWSASSGATLVIGTANIVLSGTANNNRTFGGGGLAYNRLTIGGNTSTASVTISGNNNFTEIASTKTVAHTIAFGTSVQTFGRWSVTGTVGNVVTLTGTSTANVIAGPAVTGVDYLAMGSWGISTTSPGEFYAGANSTGTATAPVFRTVAPTPRNLFWRGGTGNWSSTTSWATTSGGAGPAPIPTSLDTVTFNSLSNATAYTATIDAGVTLARSASFTMAGPASGNVTFAGSVGIAFHGSVSFAATGITRTYTGAMQWAGNASYTFTTNGLALGSACTVTGIGSTWTLGSAINTSSFTFTYGSFSTSVSNYSITSSGAFASNNSNIRSVSLNGSTLTLSTVNSSAVGFGTTTNLTFNAGASQINLAGSTSGISSTGLTFYNVSFTSAAAASVTITGSNTFNTLSFASRTTTGITPVTFSANQTISALTLNAGTASAYRTFLASNTIGAQRTLNVTTLTAGAADIDFRDIAITGAAAPISGTRFGDAKGNSGITFPAAKTVYWAQAPSVNWGSATSSWSLTNGGSADAAAFPLAQDTAFIPFARPNSGQTITVNADYNIGTIDMNERNGSALVTLATSTNSPQIYGNWINGTGTTLTANSFMTFAGRGSQTLTSAGKTFPQNFTLNMPGGTLTLQDAFISSSTSNFTLTAGTLDANGYSINISGAFLASNVNIRALAFGAGTWTLAQSGASAFSATTSTNLTITGTGTISLTNASAKTFAGGGANYSGITLNQGGAGTLTISGNNTFKNITNTYSATGATTIALGATTQTLTNPWTATGAATRVLTVNGTSAASPATLIFSGAGTAADVDYLNISNVRAYDLLNEWYAGPNSTNSGSLGWYFIAAGGTVYAVTVTETGTGTDSITGGFLYIGTVAELANSADALAAAVSFRGVVSESGSGSDVISAQSSLGGRILESATITDTNLARLIARATLSETATGTDTDSARLNANSNINETATAVDAVSAFAALLAAVLEAATATDLTNSIKGLFAYIVESATITDALNAPGSTYNPRLTETATATDSIVALARFAVQVVESASITDAAAAFKAYLAAILEAASGSDAALSRFVARTVINETATGADADAAIFTARSSVSEAATGTEIVSSLRTLRPIIAEAATGADSASTRNTARPVIAEAAIGTDASTTTAEFQSQVTETSITQDIVRGFMVIAVQVSESSTGSDQISALRALAAAVVEAVSGSDAVSAKAVFQGILQEIANLTDSVNASGSTYSAPVVELVTLQDAVRSAATFPTAVTEATTGTEINSAAFTPLARITETATVTDAASALAAFAARTAESANITDEVSPPGSIYNPVVLAVATMLDSVNAPGSIYNPRVLESATITDSLIGGYLWNLIDDSQTPSWGDVDDTQSAAWVSVDDTQSVNWQNVGNTQTPGWTDVNDNQTPGWTPILP